MCVYVIKMDTDKSLRATIKPKIYQYEKNADTLIFLLPMEYDEVNLANCTVTMNYVLPNGAGKAEELELELEPYREKWYEYRLKITTELTDLPGKIELWLNVTSPEDDLLLETGTTEIEVAKARDITQYLSPEERNRLNKMDERLSKLEKAKADNMKYDAQQQTLQLTADGAPVGDMVTLNDKAGEEWMNIEDAAAAAAKNAKAAWEPVLPK